MTKAELAFFQKGESTVLLKNLRFLQLLLLCKIDQEKVSENVLLKKTFSVTRCKPL